MLKKHENKGGILLLLVMAVPKQTNKKDYERIFLFGLLVLVNAVTLVERIGTRTGCCFRSWIRLIGLSFGLHIARRAAVAYVATHSCEAESV